MLLLLEVSSRMAARRWLGCALVACVLALIGVAKGAELGAAVGKWRAERFAAAKAAVRADEAASVGEDECPAAGDRVACVSSARWDFSQELCEARGCCYSPSLTDIDWCFNTAPAGAAANITKVHVVQGCHLDVGFARTAPEIVNLWFEQYFPLAYRVGKYLDDLQAQHSPLLNGTNTRLRFTAQSWLISMYIDCPSDWEGIRCPNATALAQFREAVQHGWITWHAFPFNTEPEFYDGPMVDFAVQLTHDVDSKLGQAKKTVMSQRDVPGMTRSIIPLLRSRGVNTISVGANGGSTPPNVPPAFIWHDPVSGENVTALYLQGGYGGIDIFNRFGYWVPTVLPGLSEVMIVDWRGDNAGPPPQASDLIHDFEELQRQFPGADVVASTFDDFAAVVHQGLQDGTVHIPTITSEIGDTWIHGTASDPVKHGRTRLAQRLRTECLDAGQCSLSDFRFWNFSRLLLKNGEHTWGLDVKSTLAPLSFERSNWQNAAFEALRTTNDEYQKLAQSWVTQSRWGLDDAVAALEDHPLAPRIEAAWKQFTTVAAPSLTGLQSVPLPPPTESMPVMKAGRFAFRVDRATGALAMLHDTTTGIVWANSTQSGTNSTSDGGALGLLEYHTHDADDYTKFMTGYNYLGPLFWFDDLDDFDKVGIDNATSGAAAVHRVLNPTMVAMWSNATTVVAQVAFPSEAVHMAGAPQQAWLRYTFPSSASDGNVTVSVTMLNKTATRYPEAAFLRVLPCASREGDDGGRCAPVAWRVEKLGEAVDPSDVVAGGARHTHVMSHGGVHASAASGSLTITSPDSGAVCFGPPRAFPTPLDGSTDFAQVSSLLVDNLWNTNYIMWFGGDLRWTWTWQFA